MKPQPVSGVDLHRRKIAREVTGKMVQYAVNLLLTAFFVFPLVFMIVSSFKTSNTQIFADLRSYKAVLLPGEISWVNYLSVFKNSNFPRFLLNSVGISAMMIILSLFVNSMAAYALSRLRWKGQKIVLTIIIATIIIPFETIAIPLLLLVSKLPNISIKDGVLALTHGWLNTYQVQIIPFVAGAYSIFLFYQFFQDIPRELDEAALVDGASRFQIYSQIIVPLSGPVFATVAILTFMSSWNAFLWPIMTVQSEEIRPVMVGLQYFFQRTIQWGEVMAYTTMITLPVLVVFMAFQNAFVKSIATTGIKG
ncbi:MAG: carbohydrate ABC transporter permease [Chloroflexota bacterium]